MQNLFSKAIKAHTGAAQSESSQKELGKPKATQFKDEESQFLKTVISLIDFGTIDTKRPETFVKKDVYDGLSPEWKAKTDQTIPNIATLLERIMDLHARPEKNESFEMKNLIESLWLAKERIEVHADVFVF